jgi:hypothetical protein
MKIQKQSRKAWKNKNHRNAVNKLNLQLRLRIRLNLNNLLQPTHNLHHLPLQPSQQLFTRRHIVNQPHRDPRAPDPRIRVAVLVHQPPARAGHEVAHVLELGVPPALDGDDLHGHFVLVHARGVVQRAEDVDGVAFGGGDDFVLDVLMNGSDESVSVIVGVLSFLQSALTIQLCT